MRLTEAVTLYVSRRRSQGSPFVSTDVTLRAFCRYCGDLRLHEVTAEHVTRFSNKSDCLPVTRLSRFSGVKCFIEYFALRGDMPSLILCRPPRSQTRRAPFIYAQSQVRALLAAADECQRRASAFDGKTLQLFLIILYATGSTVDEALTLRRCDLDLRRNRLRLGSQGRVVRPRTLPISPELSGLLREHTIGLASGPSENTLLLTASDGGPINRKSLAGRYKRLLRITVLPRSAGGYPPRLQDFRFTFAVHRLDTWIKSGADMNEMVPALSAYMGYSKLTKAEQFLDFAPERFRADLNKLSPRRSGQSWSEDPVLMRFLSEL